MENTDSLQAVNAYRSREGSGQPILDSLVAAGKNLDALTIEDLAPVDQFHGGGMGAIKGLVELAEISRSATVLDVGDGPGWTG